MSGSATSKRGAVHVKRLPVELTADERRVITLPFGLSDKARIEEIVKCVRALSDGAASMTLRRVMNRFASRHEHMAREFEERYSIVSKIVGHNGTLSADRRLLIGAYMTMEYSFASTALFNPSIVPHADQTGVPEGAVRFVMSLRATGEGHISSVVFRTGIVDAKGNVKLDPLGSFSARAKVVPDTAYSKPLFRRKLEEMSADIPAIDEVLQRLPESFTYSQLEAAMAEARQGLGDDVRYQRPFETMAWLARSNYELRFPPEAPISEFIIFPHSDNESRGIEDVRLVRFTDDDGSVSYYGTYTALNGQRMLPMLIRTENFSTIAIHTLNGRCVQDKGMALFPRRINGHYVMCGRIDGHNLFIMYSDYVHFWESAEMLASPKFPWEFKLMGNCGSPIETDRGWLLVTHGVGPMRQYSIGAMLLDLEDPLRVVGRLRYPLITPSRGEREGYVPNVVYSCGSMIHKDTLYLPYAASDTRTTMAAINVDELLTRLVEDGA